MTIRWALIGAGRHPLLRIAPAFRHVGSGELVGVWSNTRDKAQSLAQAYAIPRIYDSIADALADPAIDAVFISTPNSLHASHTIAAAQAGKHVLVEKPMATNAADARAMVDACATAGVKLGVAFHLRHHPAHIAARQLIADGVIGSIVHATGQYGLFSFTPPAIPNSPWKADPAMMGGGGSLMGMGVHVLDILTHLIGARVVEVTALTDGQTDAKPLDMLAVALLRFASGAIATMTSSARFPYSRNDLVLYGNQGRIVCAETVNMPPTGTLEVTTQYATDGSATQSYTFPAWDSFANELEAFSRAALDGSPFHADGWDGLHSVEISDAILAAQRSGRTVTIPPA
jgi:1,5-anhydro-D-fructose reductase (1,5-anhydro-D-mannitol-forming)